MNKTAEKVAKRTIRHKRLRAKISGTATRPRLAVFRSNQAIYAQLIDDVAGKTLAAADSRKVAGDTATVRATATGTAIAEKAKAAGITEVVFDRGGFQYKGAIVALAEAARAGGLKF